MTEASGEATAVWSHRARIAVLLSAMRHFRDALQDAGLPLTYLALDDPSFAAASSPERPALALALDALKPQTRRVCEPGEWRLEQEIAATAQAAGVPLIWDRHEAELAANRRKKGCRRWTRSDTGLHSNVSLR